MPLEPSRKLTWSFLMNGEHHTLIQSFDQLVTAYSSVTNQFFFVQVGANDGKLGDPLFHLVSKFGWSGVLVEPQRSVYENHLLENYAHLDGLFFENAAISDEDGHRTLFKLSFSERRWATGLASFKRSHIQQHIDIGYIERCIGNESDRLPEKLEDYITTEEVKTITFETLFVKYSISQLDLLQIDTEGFDYELLKLFDFDKIMPSIIQFEHHVMTPRERMESLNMLAKAGYLTFTDQINTVAFQQHRVQPLGLKFDAPNLRFA